MRKTEEIPVDLIVGSELYLYIGTEKINKNLVPYFKNATKDTTVKMTVEIDVDKCIWIYFGDDENIVSLGKIISESNPNYL